jgi:hypothetical protein
MMGDQQEEKHDEYIDSTQGRGHTRVHLPTGKVILNNFLGGLAWGVGTVLGATVIIALIILLLSKLSAIPVVGNFFISILNQLQHR